ncbi:MULTISPECIES: rhodanese-like domain-containing protein [unclassified Marinobacterium]|jgi:rhodanese-related sulfurtransferase|uniref:rhodanese-like domain-containing protein n=2 Tax=Marinobacterium TaxID=48075 RepID=UPI001567FC46|nr:MULTISPECIES: rhodanese-like domain-containing protein [unclassified Marinobacterium]NRP36809.1 Thiosulfate sulfurtransferase PspE precursor [Marinobacterium sp. xm-d-579]NRP38564.1 Thiosulfate sulfurtransferase PspE precursor [Marinobacterium sp. xm-a-121]NRP46708.1 Thiosulfate sulfurtransferase PspE precursor [Marinobacterium sp. xm-d-543]NRP58085.1 Thiosulfate sulfurtransferase PspE precursor [Marinobacterium sp. xm-d-510]NRP94935.1 Thiosulfate sulfurtransferase PspE precursor [Marinobac
MMRALMTSLVTILFTFNMSAAVANEEAIEAMNDYMAFQEYESGIMVPQQIDQVVFEASTFIDTRDAEQFAEATIPGAINIEWRQVLDRIDEIPETGKVILFCNTGSLSAQATFALRVAGRENVVVLQSGFIGWQQNAAYKP